MGQKLKTARADRKFTELMTDSARQIWLAGLGAFAKARSERTQLFDSLVRRGEAVQACAGKVASEQLLKVGKRTAGAWDKMEQVFEERISQSLSHLGVPTNQDIQILSKHVAELNASVQTLLKSGKHTKPRPPVEARKSARTTPSAA